MNWALYISGLMSVALVGPAIGAGPQKPPKGSPSDGKIASWTQKEIRELLPKREERKFDQIGWAPTVVEAQRLAKEHRRPMFLFTLDGDMATGRC